jgi:uncharacterized coiled-coil DUF342 family protein
MGVELALLGGLVGAGGQVFSGIEKRKALKKEAREVREEADFLAQQTREEAEKVQERQKLKFIKSGLDIAPGTVLQTLVETKTKGERQAGRISERGRKESKALRRAGRNALIGGLLRGGSTAISSFGGEDG